MKCDRCYVGWPVLVAERAVDLFQQLASIHVIGVMRWHAMKYLRPFSLACRTSLGRIKNYPAAFLCICDAEKIAVNKRRQKAGRIDVRNAQYDKPAFTAGMPRKGVEARPFRFCEGRAVVVLGKQSNEMTTPIDPVVYCRDEVTALGKVVILNDNR